MQNFVVIVATVDLETMEADQSSDETEQDNIDTTAARVARGERGGGEGVEMVETVRLLSESSSQSHEEKRVKPIHALFVQLMVTVRYDGVMLKSIHVTQLPTCFGKCSTPRPLPIKYGVMQCLIGSNFSHILLKKCEHDCTGSLHVCSSKKDNIQFAF